MSELQHDTEKDENHTVLESIVKALAKGTFCCIHYYFLPILSVSNDYCRLEALRIDPPSFICYFF